MRPMNRTSRPPIQELHYGTRTPGHTRSAPACAATTSRWLPGAGALLGAVLLAAGGLAPPSEAAAPVSLSQASPGATNQIRFPASKNPAIRAAQEEMVESFAYAGRSQDCEGTKVMRVGFPHRLLRPRLAYGPSRYTLHLTTLNLHALTLILILILTLILKPACLIFRPADALFVDSGMHGVAWQEAMQDSLGASFQSKASKQGRRGWPTASPAQTLHT